MTASPHRLLWIAAALLTLGAGLRVAGFLAPAVHPDPEYRQLADNLQAYGVLGEEERPSAFRGVMYPALIALVDSADPRAGKRLPRVQAVLDVLTVPLAAAAGAALYSPLAGLLAAGLLALHSPLHALVPNARIELAFGFLVALAGAALILWCRNPSPRRCAALGLAVSASLLCRSTLFLLPVVLLAGAGLRRRLLPVTRRGAVLLLACSYLPLLPWAARNALRFRAFVPFERQAAYQNLFSASMGLVENSPASPQDALAARTDAASLSAPDTFDWMLRSAVRRIADHPARYLASCAERLSHELGLHPWLFTFCAAALALNWSSPAVYGLSLFVGYFLAIHSPMTIEPRYLDPLIPAAAALAACGAVSLAGRCAGLPRARAIFAPAPSGAPLARMTACLLAVAGLWSLASFGYLGSETVLLSIPCRLAPSARALYYCGRSLQGQGRLAEAAADYERALALPSPAPALRASVLVNAGLIERRTRNEEAASRRFLAASLLAPAVVDAEAIRLQDEGGAADSVALFKGLTAAYPKNTDYQTDEGVALSLADDPGQSLKVLERAVAIDPSQAKAWLNLAVLRERRGQLGQALASYDKALAAERRPGPDESQTQLYWRALNMRRDCRIAAKR